MSLTLFLMPLDFNRKSIAILFLNASTNAHSFVQVPQTSPNADCQLTANIPLQEHGSPSLPTSHPPLLWANVPGNEITCMSKLTWKIIHSSKSTSPFQALPSRSCSNSGRSRVPGNTLALKQYLSEANR